MNYKDVIQVLKSRSQVIDYSGEDERIRQLVTMAIVNTANAATLEKVQDEKFNFTNGMLTMPMECISVKRVRNKDGEKIRYRSQGRNINILDYRSGQVLVDYWRLAVDEYGPAITTDEQLNYCVAYVEQMFMRDRWLTGKMGGGEYQYFEQMAQMAYNACFTEKLTNDELDRIVDLVRGAVYFPSSDVLKNL